METLFNKLLYHKKSDPCTSRIAAEKMVKSGALSRREEQVLDAIRCYKCSTWKEDFTAEELSNSSKINYYTIQRRLSGLHNKGKIERTRIGTNSKGKPIYKKRDGRCIWRVK